MHTQTLLISLMWDNIHYQVFWSWVLCVFFKILQHTSYYDNKCFRIINIFYDNILYAWLLVNFCWKSQEIVYHFNRQPNRTREGHVMITCLLTLNFPFNDLFFFFFLYTCTYQLQHNSVDINEKLYRSRIFDFVNNAPWIYQNYLKKISGLDAGFHLEKKGSVKLI